MADAKRKKDGTFRKGVSGNPGGRPPKKPHRHRLPHENRRTVFEVAEASVQVRVGEELTDASVYQGVLMSLAKKAMSGHTPSARLFLEEVRSSAYANNEQVSFFTRLLRDHQQALRELDELKAKFAPTSGVITVPLREGETLADWDVHTRRG